MAGYLSFFGKRNNLPDVCSDNILSFLAPSGPDPTPVLRERALCKQDFERCMEERHNDMYAPLREPRVEAKTPSCPLHLAACMGDAEEMKRLFALVHEDNAHAQNPLPDWMVKNLMTTLVNVDNSHMQRVFKPMRSHAYKKASIYEDMPTLEVQVRTPLHDAKTLEVAKLLVNNGAHVSGMFFPDGKTPMHTAVYQGNFEVFDFLWKTHKQRVLTETGKQAHIDDLTTIYGHSLLHYAVMLGNYGPIYLHWTFVHQYAALHSLDGREKIMRTLISEGADVNKLTHNGSTALSLAVAHGYFADMRTLLLAGADPTIRCPSWFHKPSSAKDPALTCVEWCEKNNMFNGASAGLVSETAARILHLTRGELKELKINHNMNFEHFRIALNRFHSFRRGAVYTFLPPVNH